MSSILKISTNKIAWAHQQNLGDVCKYLLGLSTVDFLVFNGVELSLQFCQGKSTEGKKIMTLKAFIQGLDHFTIFFYFPDNFYSSSLQQNKSSFNGKNKDYIKQQFFSEAASPSLV